MTATRLPAGTASAVTRRLTPSVTLALADPVRWVRTRLGEHLWSGQQAIFESIRDHRKTAVQSCHGIGKSFSASRAAAWWIDTHPIGEAMVVSTAPSGHQVRTILWGEIQKAHRKGMLAGYITRGQVPEWIIDGQQVGFGRKSADRVNEDEARTAFQGIHARYLLVILDEACGCPKWLWDAMLSLVTNHDSRVLAIGNPDDPTSHFASVCSNTSDWNVLQFSVLDTPNFTSEQVPAILRDSLVSQLWVDEAAKEWGIESPMYCSKVLGQFPEVADDVIINPRLIREAHQTDLSGHALTDPGRFGMDVARLGSDETVIYRNRAGMIRLQDAWRKTDTDTSRQKAQDILERDRYRQMQVDVVGLGAGVYDPLANSGFNVVPFNGGETANNPERFANRNAEAWWTFRKAMESGLIDLDPDDLTLAAQLQGRRWATDQRRIKIESKDDMAKRGLGSPDRADAAILSWYEGVRTIGDVTTLIADQRNGPKSITGDLLTTLT